jgi:hypothetical protein
MWWLHPVRLQGKNAMRRRAFLISLLGAGAFCAPAAKPAAAAAIEGFLAIGGISVRSDAARPEWGWRDGFLGRLDAADEERFQAEGLMVIEVGGGAAGSGAAGSGTTVSFVLQAALRQGFADDDESVAGLAQAFGKYERGWGEHPENRLAARLGFFFLPSSRENVEVGWSSPYTLTYSALNTWMGEEVRPIGLEASLRRGFGEHSLEAAAIVFGGNDAAGAMLAWRGFAMSSQVTQLNEVLPLPALPSLAAAGSFNKQRDDGSQSFSDDLDGRPGYYLALRWQKKERFVLQADHWDNRGDRGLYQGEYAWATRFDHLAVEVDALPDLKILGEWLQGETGMGLPNRVMVDAEFEAAYLLASWQRGPFRLSLRRDQFEVEDHDDFYEPTSDEGHAWTAALLFDTPAKAWRFGLEWLRVDGKHEAAPLIGADPAVETRSLRLEVRYYFGS